MRNWIFSKESWLTIRAFQELTRPYLRRIHVRTKSRGMLRTWQYDDDGDDDWIESAEKATETRFDCKRASGDGWNECYVSLQGNC